MPEVEINNCQSPVSQSRVLPELVQSPVSHSCVPSDIVQPQRKRKSETECCLPCKKLNPEEKSLTMWVLYLFFLIDILWIYIYIHIYNNFFSLVLSENQMIKVNMWDVLFLPRTILLQKWAAGFYNFRCIKNCYVIHVYTLKYINGRICRG